MQCGIKHQREITAVKEAVCFSEYQDIHSNTIKNVSQQNTVLGKFLKHVLVFGIAYLNTKHAIDTM